MTKQAGGYVDAYLDVVNSGFDRSIPITTRLHRISSLECRVQRGCDVIYHSVYLCLQVARGSGKMSFPKAPNLARWTTNAAIYAKVGKDRKGGQAIITREGETPVNKDADHHLVRGADEYLSSPFHILIHFVLAAVYKIPVPARQYRAPSSN